MPSVPLPENASLEHLKKQARLLHELARSGDQGALDLAREFHPRMGDVDASAVSRFKRSDAQLIVARLYGFPSWPRLRSHLGLLDDFARPDPADRDPGDGAERFVALACVSYGTDAPAERIDRARRMFEADPDLAVSSVAAMSVTGDHRRLSDRLEHDPDLANATCGPNRWPPILYCAYSRVPATGRSHSLLETARVLLEAGADPNAGFLWRGLMPPFTALTGAFGGGEQDQPPHADSWALARLLLEAGADPNDGQALYNNGLAGTAHDDAAHLELLVEFGLGTDRSGPWYARFGSQLTPPVELLYDELEVAAHRGLTDRLRFLVGLGLDLDRGVGRSGRSPRQLAERKGHDGILAVLAAAGVPGGRKADDEG